jgi:uncharacterized iron-regulated membrane protein
VWIDPGTGAILAVRDTRQDSAGDRFMDWMHPLHNGEAFGLAGRVLACVGGLLPAAAGDRLAALAPQAGGAAADGGAAAAA